jgi:multisubunit Na+/H+ antiporter MnhG subunit
MDKYPLNVFSRYVEGNKSSLTGIGGVIATIAALFLNLDQSVFGDSLRNLQLLLLLFLILGLIFLTINSLFWFKNNADS